MPVKHSLLAVGTYGLKAIYIKNLKIFFGIFQILLYLENLHKNLCVYFNFRSIKGNP